MQFSWYTMSLLHGFIHFTSIFHGDFVGKILRNSAVLLVHCNCHECMGLFIF